MKVFRRTPKSRAKSSELIPEFKDSEIGEDYRYAYAEEHLNTWIALQIKAIREVRGLKQSELAEKIGTQQPAVARFENANYSKWKVETLKKVARALDVRLKITFESFGSLLDEDANFNRESLLIPAFGDDPAFRDSTGLDQSSEVDERVARALQSVQEDSQEVPKIEDYVRLRDSERKFVELAQGGKQRANLGRQNG